MRGSPPSSATRWRTAGSCITWRSASSSLATTAGGAAGEVGGGAADQDYLDIRVPGPGQLGQVEAIQPRAEIDIGDQHIRHLPGAEQDQRILGIGQAIHLEAMPVERLGQDAPDEFVVLDQQDPHSFRFLTRELP